jgi:hypothetical protein
MSQIPRYLYGKTNVSELQSQRSSAITPAEGAAAAAAPFVAAGRAAGDISNDLLELQKQKNQIQAENDKILAATNIANASTDLKLLRKQANQEQWTQEQFETASEARIGDFVSSVDQISERNQDRAGFAYGAEAQRMLAITQLEGVDINTDRTREAFATSYERLGAAGDYEAQLAMLDAAGSSKGIKLFEPEELAQEKRNVEGNMICKDTVGRSCRAAQRPSETLVLQVVNLDMPWNPAS